MYQILEFNQFTRRHTRRHTQQCDYERLNTLDARRRAILSSFCGNDYIGHLFMFTIGQKPAEGRRGRALTAMSKYVELADDTARLGYLQQLELDNRWSDTDKQPATGFTKEFLRCLRTVYHYPVYKLTFPTSRYEHACPSHSHTLSLTHCLTLSHCLTLTHRGETCRQ